MAATPVSRPAHLQDPLHTYTASSAFWTTVNVSEAIPGVPTAMNWSIFRIGGDGSTPRAYHKLGILPRRELAETATDRRLTGIFHGRVAINVTRIRQVADLTPGTSGSAMERQMLGSARDGVPDESSWRRVPFVAVRFPWQAVRLPAALRRLHDDQHRWWADTTSAPRASSLQTLRTAVERFDHAMTVHLMALAISQACFEQVTRLAESAGDPSLVPRLTSGYGGYEEAAMIEELWRVARAERTGEQFLARYGFHGPDEGEISSPSWREDPGLVTVLATRYAEQGREDGDRERTQRRERRRLAERELLAALTPPRRARARVVLRLAERYLPLREIGKAAFLMAVDVARFAVRRRGAELAEAMLLADPDDIFCFTVEEVLDGLPADAAELAEFRRAKRREYQALRVPDVWLGTPEPSPLDGAGAAPAVVGETIRGVPVTGGVVDGRVRVATSLHAAEEIDPDEILVCEVTDPSWCTVFPLIRGMVVDIGGPLSHAAIVAREMAIPCVINTKEAARRLSTGMRVRLDAGRGTVEVLEP